MSRVDIKFKEGRGPHEISHINNVINIVFENGIVAISKNSQVYYFNLDCIAAIVEYKN